jgi:hypothetical protein
MADITKEANEKYFVNASSNMAATTSQEEKTYAEKKIEIKAQGARLTKLFIKNFKWVSCGLR